MKNLHFLVIIILLFSCTRQPLNNKTDVFGSGEKALWIADHRALPLADSLFYTDQPAPLFRKEFTPEKDVKRATLYITAAGYYRASLNGTTIGKNILDPAWTDFSKRIYFSEYDVTRLIKEGKNSLGVSLGNGFYNPLPLRKWGRRNLRNDIAVGKPTFIAKLIIDYTDGKSEEIVTDNSWKYAYGPLIKNSVYIGVIYDAGKEIKKWDHPEFNAQNWTPAYNDSGPGGELQKSFFPGVEITREITPVQITEPEEGIFLVDMGENFTGTYKIRIDGNKGDTVTFRFGERIYDDGSLNPMTAVIGQIKRKGVGGPGSPEIAWQTDSYIAGQSNPEWFSPDFTYHTYRYMEIKGLSKKPEIADIKGLFMNSNVKNKNAFQCSSDLLNSIQEATERTFLANMISVQSDCPAREKFGYGGDLNATSESFIYNFDMQAFYRKTIYDWVDAMNDSCFVDTAPYVGIKYCGISWESAFLTTQYYLYLYYNDTGIIKEFYDLNKAWMEKAARLHPNGLVDKGLSDHESLQPVPVQLTGTCHYMQCAEIMRLFASKMNDPESEKKYEKLAERLRDLVKSEFWDKSVNGNINRQTLFCTLLYHNIIPAQEINAAKDSLLTAVKNGPSGHFNTGIFGTKYILEMLSENVNPESVFAIVNSTSYPGWGHMIDRGASTIWETWKESDNTYSNCHPMFGTVTEWYFRWLAGIRPDINNPGFKEFILAPSIPDSLDFVNCKYQSPYGEIVSNWKVDKNGNCTYDFIIPEESIAKVKVPMSPSDEIEINSKNESLKVKDIIGLETGSFKLPGGEYVITVSSNEE